MDYFLDNDDKHNDASSDNACDIKPSSHIEYQLDKYNINEYFIHKHIPENALFISDIFKQHIKAFYTSNIDVPLLIYGVKGCGKITALIGLINNVPGYVSSTFASIDTRKINNLYYMKNLDIEYNKLFIYENLYYLNIDILASPSEILLYIKHIYTLGKSKSIDGTKKIIIISHIDKCSLEAQKYITYILYKQNNNTSYIFTITKNNTLLKKISSGCAKINFKHLTKTEFINIFNFNYKYLSLKTNQYNTDFFYTIYINNQYNIGNTIAQIKHIIYTSTLITSLPFTNPTTNPTTNLTTNPTTNPTTNHNAIQTQEHSLLYNIVKSFIKKYIKLSTVNNALDIRTFLYTLTSLNIDFIDFITLLVKQLIRTNPQDDTSFNLNLSFDIKHIIITEAGILSHNILTHNKEIINIETFIYKIINIIYSSTTI